MSSKFDSDQFNQNLFFPRRDPSVPPPDSDEIYVEVEKSIRVHVRRYPSEKSKFSLLYFHGNGEIAADYDNIVPYFSALSAELIVADYRGYGKSEGFPTLRKVLDDAHIICRSLKSQKKLKDRICVMGRSLGSASAIELSRKYKDISCCVIESGYADPIPLVERRGLKIDQTTPEEDAIFNNSKKISGVICPLLIMHGEDDFLISPKEAQLNFEQAGSEQKELVILEGVGHNDIMMAPNNAYFMTLKKFFESTVVR